MIKATKILKLKRNFNQAFNYSQLIKDIRLEKINWLNKI